MSENAYEMVHTFTLADFADAIARIPRFAPEQIRDMREDYDRELRELAREVATLGESVIGIDHGTIPPTARVWHVGSRTGKGFPSATLAHFEAAGPPPKPAPRGVCVGLALAGWAS